MISRTALSLAGTIAVLAVAAHAAPPVFPEGSDVPSTIPCGKTLVIPLTADDPDGDHVSYTVTSSNPKIMARVRSGNFHYKVRVETDDDGSVPGQATPFQGDMEFQLFRHATPETAAFIAGFAQSGYYDDVTFHRVIPDFVIQGGDPAGTGSGGSPYSIRHEFRPELIYSGRGQLAMANSSGGYSQSFPNNGHPDYRTGSFSATNGSQFFVTLAQPRHLSFKHTLFGQLVRGFETLDHIAGVETDNQDKPKSPVKMTEHTVTASRTDGILLLSAAGVGSANVTVIARDTNGQTAQKVFAVQGVADTFNDPPMLLPFEPTVAPVGQLPNISLRSFDLEHDGISTRFPVQDLNDGRIIYAGLDFNNLSATARPGPGAWDVAIGVGGLNDPLLGVDPFNSLRFETLEVGVGDKALSVTSQTVEAIAATDTGATVLATFRHGSAGASPDDFIVLVNWGDGSAPESNKGVNPSVSLVRSPTQPGAYDVVGAHTFARTGLYPLHVTVDGPLGATQTGRGWTVVNAADSILRAVGVDVGQRGPIFAGRPIAYFTDSTPGARPRDFSTIVDWGDGMRSEATIRQVGHGRFAVIGRHRYQDAEAYSVAVHIRRKDLPVEAVAWSRIEVRGFQGPDHLPPFSKANITSFWSENPHKVYRGSAVDINATLFLLNGGDKPTKKWKLKIWLSADATLDANDTLLKMGPLKKQLTELALNSLAPGGGGNLPLKPYEGGDLTIRLPGNESGAGKYVIAQLVYSDPITDHMKVPKTVSFGPLTGIIATTPPTFVIREDGTNNQGSAVFRVRLDTAPTQPVTIPLDIAVNGVPNTTRATLDKTQLIFTPANGTVDQEVRITAKDDLIQNPQSQNTLTIRLKAAASSDPRFSNMDAPDLQVSIADNPRNVVVSPTALTIKEGNAAQVFRVRLQTAPKGSVTIPLEIVNAGGSPDTSRATLDRQQLVFNALNGTADQVVTVTAVDDAVVNGNANFTIRVKPALSTETEAPNYNGRESADVALIIQDNDAAGITVAPQALTVQEGGDARTFSVKLNTLPSADVTVPLQIVNADGNPDTSRLQIDVSSLVFTPTNGTTAQTVTVAAVDDAEVNGTGIYTIRVLPAVSADESGPYHGLDATDVSVGVQDNDPNGGVAGNN